MKSLDYKWGQIGNINFHTYLALKPGTDQKAFEKLFPDYIAKYFIPALKEFQIYSLADFEKSGNRVRFSLIPVTRIHLYSDRQGGEELSPPGSIQYVAIFSAVALFILLIACVNFMNLTTARSVKRAKEIGIRKVVGAVRPALIRQFISEAVLFSFFSMILALAMVILILPVFNQLTGKHIIFPYGSSSFWLWLAALTQVFSLHPLIHDTLKHGQRETQNTNGRVACSRLSAVHSSCLKWA